MTSTRKARLTLIGVGTLVGAAFVSPLNANAAPPNYTLATIQGFGGEPSMTSDTLGNLYESSPSTVRR